ncbi:HEPN domain-containing protein [Photobacterium lipolyticum]|nr:HEPN domain-containing protein [Photobacterium lipolyticum]
MINLSDYDHWIAISITGVITAPIVPLGLGPDMYICRESHMPSNLKGKFIKSLRASFESFGLEASTKLTLNDPKLLLVPICNSDEETVKNALIVADMALALFNKKYFSARAKFINWDRKLGKAVGVVSSKGKLSSILASNSSYGPAIAQPLGQDVWDWLLGSFLRGNLTELGNRVYKCLEWEREAQFSSHITHKFAFNWIGLESMLPNGEVSEAYLVQRYSFVVGAPRGADSKILIDSALKDLFIEHKNPEGKKWVKEIQNMYRYRCAIFHDGSSDLTSDDIEPKKVDWYYHLSKQLSMRVIGYAIAAICDGVETVDDFWGDYMLKKVFNEENIWLKNGTLHLNDAINFDWAGDEAYYEI